MYDRRAKHPFERTVTGTGNLRYLYIQFEKF